MTRAKLWMSFLGMGLALAAVATSSTVLVWVAIAVLGLAVVFRILARRRDRTEPSESADPEAPPS